MEKLLSEYEPVTFLSAPTLLTAARISTKCPLRLPELVRMSETLRNAEEALLGILNRCWYEEQSPK